MKTTLHSTVAALLLAALSAIAADEANTAAGWRGDGTGCFPAADPVTEWSPKSNVLWSVKAGLGTSSPIAVGGRVFLTAEPNLLLCFEAASGKECWRKVHKAAELPAELHFKDPEKPDADFAGWAVPTPVSDGKWVYVAFGTGIVACYDLEGQRRWVKWFDVPMRNKYGRTSSPILVKDRLLLQLDPLLCLEAATGKLLWQNDKTDSSYGTPAATSVGGVDVVVTPKGDLVRVSDGKILADTLGATRYASPVIQGNIVYFIDAVSIADQLPEKLGEKVDPKELWNEEIEPEYFASAVVHEGLIYAVNANAVYHVLDAKTGKTLLKEPLKLPPCGQHSASVLVYPSLALAGKHLFVNNNVGDTDVLNLGQKLDEVKLSSLSQGCGASCFFAGRCIFMRSGDVLYCIGGGSR